MNSWLRADLIAAREGKITFFEGKRLLKICKCNSQNLKIKLLTSL